MLSDLPAIAELAHAAGVPVIVDQAWGSHLGLHPALPANALAMGADAMVVSAHKTLTAFTQGAMVFARGDLIDRDRLVRGFDALNTTSPSAAIYASLDRAAADGAARRRAARAHARTAAGFRADASGIEGLRVLGQSITATQPAAFGVDPVKLVVSLPGTGTDGFDVERDLLADGVRLEMADRETLVPLLTIGDDERSVGRLSAALARSTAAPRRAAADLLVDRLAAAAGAGDGAARRVLRPARARQRRARGRPDQRRDRGALPARHPRARTRRADHRRAGREPARRGGRRYARRVLLGPGARPDPRRRLLSRGPAIQTKSQVARST